MADENMELDMPDIRLGPFKKEDGTVVVNPPAAGEIVLDKENTAVESTTHLPVPGPYKTEDGLYVTARPGNVDLEPGISHGNSLGVETIPGALRPQPFKTEDGLLVAAPQGLNVDLTKENGPSEPMETTEEVDKKPVIGRKKKIKQEKATEPARRTRGSRQKKIIDFIDLDGDASDSNPVKTEPPTSISEEIVQETQEIELSEQPETISPETALPGIEPQAPPIQKAPAAAPRKRKTLKRNQKNRQAVENLENVTVSDGATEPTETPPTQEVAPPSGAMPMLCLDCLELDGVKEEFQKRFLLQAEKEEHCKIHMKQTGRKSLREQLLRCFPGPEQAAKREADIRYDLAKQAAQIEAARQLDTIPEEPVASPMQEENIETISLMGEAPPPSEDGSTSEVTSVDESSETPVLQFPEELTMAVKRCSRGALKCWKCPADKAKLEKKPTLEAAIEQHVIFHAVEIGKRVLECLWCNYSGAKMKVHIFQNHKTEYKQHGYSWKNNKTEFDTVLKGLLVECFGTQSRRKSLAKIKAEPMEQGDEELTVTASKNMDKVTAKIKDEPKTEAEDSTEKNTAPKPLAPIFQKRVKKEPKKEIKKEPDLVDIVSDGSEKSPEVSVRNQRKMDDDEAGIKDAGNKESEKKQKGTEQESVEKEVAEGSSGGSAPKGKPKKKLASRKKK